MPVQTHISIPSIGLISKALLERASKQLEMENDKKNMNKEMLTDILMVVLLVAGPVLMALVL
jgi:hypothetical protein